MSRLQPESNTTSWHDNEEDTASERQDEPGQINPFPSRNTPLPAQRYRPRRSSSGISASSVTSRDTGPGRSDVPRPDLPGALSNHGMINEAGRQGLMAMDRKRRLTGANQDSGRPRHAPGSFYERDNNILDRLLDNTSSSSRAGPQSYARPISNVPFPQHVIDLTQSSPPARNNAPLPALPQPQSSLQNYSLPRWQPDSEVSECPICKRPFSFLFRRHHCRKCGRVVCNDCSPHRITIPRQYIVCPPGSDMSLPIREASIIDLTEDEEDTDNSHGVNSSQSSLTTHSHFNQPTFRTGAGGGEKVRLCNPCVPDPQPEHLPSYSSRTLPPLHGPSRRIDRPPAMIPTASESLRARPHNGIQPYTGISVPNYIPPFGQRSHSLSHAHGHLHSQSPSNSQSHTHSRSRSQRNPASTFDSFALPPSSLVTPSGASFTAARHHHRSGLPIDVPFSGHGRYHSLDHVGPSLHATTRPRVGSMFEDASHFQRLLAGHIPQPARRQLNEDDICPVCRRALPPRGRDGDETAREAHIMECITARDPSTPTAQSRSMGSPASPPRGPMHMLTFVATEKDCVGEDDAALECSICMVEYDVGEQLARLECLCKFHRDCIVSWFERKQECPVHKIT